MFWWHSAYKALHGLTPASPFKPQLPLHLLLGTHIELLTKLNLIPHSLQPLRVQRTSLSSPIDWCSSPQSFSMSHFIHHLLLHIINYSSLFLISQIQVKCASYVLPHNCGYPFNCPDHMYDAFKKKICISHWSVNSTRQRLHQSCSYQLLNKYLLGK